MASWKSGRAFISLPAFPARLSRCFLRLSRKCANARNEAIGRWRPTADPGHRQLLAGMPVPRQSEIGDGVKVRRSNDFQRMRPGVTTGRCRRELKPLSHARLHLRRTRAPRTTRVLPPNGLYGFTRTQRPSRAHGADGTIARPSPSPKSHRECLRMASQAQGCSMTRRNVTEAKSS